ncbi:rhodanese-like domain-containing protein [Vibrio sp. ZSDZ65]|uniref:Rhodanese-like domain-containing protein n=1 Tax=Vibrio qingdaonensis TaxID=2829491 RepID=A0A9X3CMV4_9VIBR|nr:rhodanese-like domain-containing protein [Vibrio qingdaonensis]MCW8346303.1 rhodanese-like domain-containing protein [Vibrio qingdaonensis]
MQEYLDFLQQNMIMAVVWAALFVALIANFVKSANAAYKEVSAAQVTQMMNHDSALVVDIRSKDDFKRGHITDAVNVLPSDIKAESTPSLENKKSDPIIVVCKTGQTAQESANLLAKSGFEQVYVLKGGLSAWSEANLPLIKGKK